jgi:hypothetical protein
LEGPAGAGLQIRLIANYSPEPECRVIDAQEVSHTMNPANLLPAPHALSNFLQLGAFSPSKHRVNRRTPNADG